MSKNRFSVDDRPGCRRPRWRYDRARRPRSPSTTDVVPTTTTTPRLRPPHTTPDCCVRRRLRWRSDHVYRPQPPPMNATSTDDHSDATTAPVAVHTFPADDCLPRPSTVTATPDYARRSQLSDDSEAHRRIFRRFIYKPWRSRESQTMIKSLDNRQVDRCQSSTIIHNSACQDYQPAVCPTRHDPKISRQPSASSPPAAHRLPLAARSNAYVVASETPLVQ